MSRHCRYYNAVVFVLQQVEFLALKVDSPGCKITELCSACFYMHAARAKKW